MATAGFGGGSNQTVELNEEQLAAVNAKDGVYVVLGGPGSGKTTMLVQRYLKMLTGGIHFDQMLNPTFTLKLA
jgi:superfamily I DNA/RNA helicase